MKNCLAKLCEKLYVNRVAIHTNALREKWSKNPDLPSRIEPRSHQLQDCEASQYTKEKSSVIKLTVAMHPMPSEARPGGKQ